MIDSDSEAFAKWSATEDFATTLQCNMTEMLMAAFKAGRRSVVPLVKSIWAYATGEDDPLEVIGVDEAHCEGEAFAKLHESVMKLVEE